MAPTVSGSSIYIIVIIVVVILPSIITASAHGEAETSFAKRVPLKRQLKEKMSHLHFYFHDVVSGPNPTAVPITAPKRATPWAFGMITMMDDKLTEGPDPTSRPVGRAQGMYAAAAQEELGFLMAMNLEFTAGKYNGSVLSVLGRNPPFNPVREMPVVGGSGLFRFARGFALARTHWLDVETGDAVVEYNVSVIHY